MGIKFSEQQRKKLAILKYYPIALKKIRAEYLANFKNAANLSPDDREEIWNASFTLKCMIALTEKYYSLIYEFVSTPLEMLANQEELNLIAEILDQITEDPAEDIHGFILHFCKLCESEDFKNKLANIAAQNYRNIWHANIVRFLAVVSYLIVPLIVVALAFVFPISPSAILGTLLAQAVIFPFVASYCSPINYSPDPRISRIISKMNSPEPESFKLKDEYSYEPDGQDETIRLAHNETIERIYPPARIEQLSEENQADPESTIKPESFKFKDEYSSVLDAPDQISGIFHKKNHALPSRIAVATSVYESRVFLSKENDAEPVSTIRDRFFSKRFFHQANILSEEVQMLINREMRPPA